MTTRSDGGSVVLELGGDVGAVVVRTDDALAGAELQIEGADRSGTRYRTHAIARPRHMGGSTVFAAVFPSVPTGSYAVWHVPGRRVDVVVAGGAVTEALLA